MRPEEKVEIELWDWLNKFKGIQIYFNCYNKACKELGYKKFRVVGNQTKPDFIISYFNEFAGKEYIAIEIKCGNRSANIYDSIKIFTTYYKNYVEKKTKYLIENTEIKISHFIIATQFSKLGKLFSDDNKVIDNINKGKNDDWRRMSAGNKTLPRCEYEKTRSFLRVLWKLFKPYREKTKNEPGLGILVSDILTDFHPKELKIQSGMIGKPLIEIMQWKKWLKKPQWQQNIIKIGKEKRYG